MGPSNAGSAPDGERGPGAPVGAGVGPRFAAALQMAWDLHREQRRKGSGVSYLGHLLTVAGLVVDAGGSEDQAIAALLHDGPEDHGGLATLRDIEARFGAGVAGIVEACSDTLEQSKPRWRTRKEAFVESIGSAPAEAWLVMLADKLANARSLARDLGQVGPGYVEHFNAGAEEQLWYFEALRSALVPRVGGWIAEEYSEVVGALAGLLRPGRRAASP